MSQFLFKSVRIRSPKQKTGPKFRMHRFKKNSRTTRQNRYSTTKLYRPNRKQQKILKQAGRRYRARMNTIETRLKRIWSTQKISR